MGDAIILSDEPCKYGWMFYRGKHYDEYVILYAETLEELTHRQHLSDKSGKSVILDLDMNEYWRLRPMVSKIQLTISRANKLQNKDFGILGDVSDPYVVATIGEREVGRTKTIPDNLD